MAVPSEEGGGGRWSLDHLFLDQDAIPTLVEVKRSTDSRIRREVVGQMLDYAANAVAYWPVEQIRARFEARCVDAGRDRVLKLPMLRGEDDPEEFWATGENEPAGGQGPHDLRRRRDSTRASPRSRIPQRPDGPRRGSSPSRSSNMWARDSKTLVPRVIGQTAEAEKRKLPRPTGSVRWNEASFSPKSRRRNGRGRRRRCAEDIRLGASREDESRSGSGKASTGSFGLTVPVDGSKRYLFAAWTYGEIEVYFQWLKSARTFRREQAARVFGPSQ